MIDRNVFSLLRITWEETHRVCPVLGIVEFWKLVINKAHIFSRQFESVYTRKNAGDVPLNGSSPYPDREDISIGPNGVKKLLDRLNHNKASVQMTSVSGFWKNAVLKLFRSWPAFSTNPLSKQLYQPMWFLYIRKERSTTRQITGQFLWPVYMYVVKR